MARPDISLPSGYRIAFFEKLDSTNSEALRLAGAGEEGGLWVWALAQEAGRGRLGRQWDSREGNLFASLLLRPECEVGAASQLAFVAGLALHSAATELAGRDSDIDFRLKWPNDLHCNGSKAGGILLESMNDAAQGLAVAIGIGLNLASRPGRTVFPATSLAQHGITAEPGAALECLARACDKWLGVWSNSAGFAEIRDAWMRASPPLGSAIGVKLAGQTMTGTFQGIDGTGALILVTDEGEEKRITTGDVFPL